LGATRYANNGVVPRAPWGNPLWITCGVCLSSVSCMRLRWEGKAQ